MNHILGGLQTAAGLVSDPGVAREYSASMVANLISTASASELTVRDPSFTATGKLVNGTTALATPLSAMATDAGHPSGAFAPLPSDRSSLRLLPYAGPISNELVTIGLRQSIAADEALLNGNYSKTLVFTLSTSTP